MFRLGLRRAFERQRDVTVSWDMGDARRLNETLAADPVDVVLIDLHLGAGPDGVTATRSLVRAQPKVKVVVLTASLDPRSITAARQAGACGYLAKDIGAAELVAEIKRLAAPGASTVGFSHGLPGTPASPAVTLLVLRGLTDREREVLVELKDGLTNREIAARLGVSVTTVNKHVQHVLKKLNVRNRGQAVARVIGRPIAS